VGNLDCDNTGVVRRRDFEMVGIKIMSPCPQQHLAVSSFFTNLSVLNNNVVFTSIFITASCKHAFYLCNDTLKFADDALL
jgi:hypothetical protein